MASSLISLSHSVAAAAQKGKNSFLIPRTECCKAHVHLPVVQLSLNQIGIINFKDCWNPFFDFQYLIVSVWTDFSVRGKSVLSAVGSSEYPLKTQLCWWYYLPHYHIPHPWDAYMGYKFLAGRESDFFFFLRGSPYALVMIIICEKYKRVAWSQQHMKESFPLQ